MIEDIEKAEKFIFLEYYIVAKGEVWNQIHYVLKQKAAEGVEIRLLYDDVGSIMTLSDSLIKQLRAEGIQVMAFNPAHKFILRLYINYRNHQRIVVIDGNIGYTGGANINDECVNLRSKYGYWKDTAIRLKGDAVWSMTVIFLQMWQLESKKSENYFKYQPTIKLEGDGFYQPFSDGPFNNPRNPAETMYHQMISNAKEYIYITTPYLIIDASMIERLCIAVKSGVDVRIVVPKIFDKWNAQKVSRSNYEELMDAGVRIYEYSPGYIHAKTIISDDDHAITGSINMNYRSFYLHFENGIWICDAPVISDIKNDIEQTFEVSEEIFINEWKNRSRIEKAMESLLCVLSPLF